MTCPTCTEPEWAPGRYCAPRRCLCGHDTCPAFASWQPLTSLNVTPIKARRRTGKSAWDERSEAGWIDKL